MNYFDPIEPALLNIYRIIATVLGSLCTQRSLDIPTENSHKVKVVSLQSKLLSIPQPDKDLGLKVCMIEEEKCSKYKQHVMSCEQGKSPFAWR